ncbi:hypothetical protein [Nonomuraea sp. NPDC049750]
MHEQVGIDSVEDLEAAIRAGRLHGIGARAEESLLDGIDAPVTVVRM